MKAGQFKTILGVILLHKREGELETDSNNFVPILDLRN